MRVVTVTMNPALDHTISVEKLSPNQLNRGTASRVDVGGKGINMGRVLNSFGANVTLTGLLGRENYGFFIDLMERENLSHDFIKTTGKTRTNIKVFDQSNSSITEINEAGFSVTDKTLEQFFHKLNSLLDGADFLLLGGSLPVNVPPDFYKECILLAHTKGVPSILDADGEGFKHGISAIPYGVKPNLYELESYLNTSLTSHKEILKGALHLSSMGINTVLVSLGEDGSIITNGKTSLKTTPWQIKVAGTVGAGDSMSATLAWGISQGKSLEEIAAITTSAGTVSAEKTGTKLASFQEIIHNMDKVLVSEIND